MTTHGIAVYSACTPCAAEWLPYAEEYAPGRWMGIAHASHAGELVAIGWVLTEYPDEPPDCVCRHYHEAYWQDGDGEDGEDPGETTADTDGDRDGGSAPPTA